LNFGAFLAFMGVNLSVFWHFNGSRQRYKRRLLADTVLPLIGFTFCASIWWNLSGLAKLVGGLWFLIGFLYLAITTRMLTRAPKMIDFSESS
jgi:putrescine importer